VDRQVVGTRAGWRADERAVAGQLIHAFLAVDENPDLCRLARLAQHGDFVHGDGFVRFAVGRKGGHAQRVQRDLGRFLQTLEKVAFLVAIHEEPDCAAMHAEDRRLQLHIVMHGFQHKAVAAQGQNNVGIFRPALTVSLRQNIQSLAGGISIRGHKSDACVRHWMAVLTDRTCAGEYIAGQGQR
jgi:hypothetical protein